MADRAEDRRQAPRRFYKTQAVCQKGQDGLGEVVTGQIINISAKGAHVLVRGDFESNETFFLALVNPRRETIAEIRGTVCWCEREGPGVFRIGVEFDGTLTDKQLTNVT
jgi:hypothetical protein